MSNMKLKYIPFIILLVVFQQQLLLAQTLDDAKAWYLEGRYAEALPIFKAEYQVNPKDAALNQWLGVSLYKTGRHTEAEQYLKFASERKIPEAYLSLGELYANLYQFEDAEKEFEKYQRANRRNNEALGRLDLIREHSTRLQRAVSRAEDIQIIDSLVLPKKDFLNAYNLSLTSGSVIPINEFFKDNSLNDKTLFINERKDKIYYSSGEVDTNLFTMEKLLDTFGNEKLLPSSINDAGSQAYPFVLSDGLTIYFSSTGHQSFGGYDIYVTRYNLSNDSYLTPNQMNMPFNSPFNDYLMVVDEEKGVGWFTSDRFQPADSVCVYTFIPNERISLLESDDINFMASRAKINSIADTWKDGFDYNNLRALAREISVRQEATSGDFVFVINDYTTYHSLADFKSSNSRSIFSQALGIEKQYEDAVRELNQKREQYATGGEISNNLRSSILELERVSETLYLETQRLKIQARNDEIRNNFN